MGNIYLIVNKIDNKKYIGQTTTSVEERFKAHLRTNKNLPLYNAIKKYGKENFEVFCLMSNVNEDELDYYEMYFIEYYNTFVDGYNMTKGGKGFRGIHSDVTKERISISMNNDEIRQKIFTEIRAIKISNALKNRKKSLEHRLKLSANAKKRTGYKNPFYNKSHTISSKAKISNKNSKPVLMLSQDNKVIREFKNGRDGANYIKNLLSLKYKVESIYRRINWRCAKQDLKPYMNYIWKYKV